MNKRVNKLLINFDASTNRNWIASMILYLTTHAARMTENACEGVKVRKRNRVVRIKTSTVFLFYAFTSVFGKI